MLSLSNDQSAVLAHFFLFETGITGRCQLSERCRLNFGGILAGVLYPHTIIFCTHFFYLSIPDWGMSNLLCTIHMWNVAMTCRVACIAQSNMNFQCTLSLTIALSSSQSTRNFCSSCKSSSATAAWNSRPNSPSRGASRVSMYNEPERLHNQSQY